MVSEFGLSQAIGPVSYGGAYGQPFSGPGASPGCSEQTQWLIDREVAALLTDAKGLPLYFYGADTAATTVSSLGHAGPWVRPYPGAIRRSHRCGGCFYEQ